jgi:hypothetical protein
MMMSWKLVGITFKEAHGVLGVNFNIYMVGMFESILKNTVNVETTSQIL